MFTTIAGQSRKILGTLQNRLAPTAAELKARQRVAFSVLHPQVQTAKRLPPLQIAVAAAISGLVLSGNLASAAGLAAAWCFSKPLTQAVAGGVGAVGLVDARLLATLQRLQQTQFEPA